MVEKLFDSIIKNFGTEIELLKRVISSLHIVLLADAAKIGKKTIIASFFLKKCKRYECSGSILVLVFFELQGLSVEHGIGREVNPIAKDN